MDWVAIVACVSSLLWLGYTVWMRQKIYDGGVTAGYKMGLQAQMLHHIQAQLTGAKHADIIDRAIAEATRKREAGGSN